MLLLYHLLPRFPIATAYPVLRRERFCTSSTSPCTICIRRPANKPTSTILITTVVPMKCDARLNICPSSPAQMHAFTPTWTTRKEIRKIPVRDMINFFPIDDVKNSDHFIVALKIENQGNKAKVSKEMGNPYLSRSKI